MIGLDTNVLVRYVTQDDAAQSALANQVIEEQLTPRNPGFISSIVLVEQVLNLSLGSQIDKLRFELTASAELKSDFLRIKALGSTTHSSWRRPRTVYPRVFGSWSAGL